MKKETYTLNYFIPETLRPSRACVVFYTAIFAGERGGVWVEVVPRGLHALVLLQALPAPSALAAVNHYLFLTISVPPSSTGIHLYNLPKTETIPNG